MKLEIPDGIWDYYDTYFLFSVRRSIDYFQNEIQVKIWKIQQSIISLFQRKF